MVYGAVPGARCVGIDGYAPDLSPIMWVIGAAMPLPMSLAMGTFE